MFVYISANDLVQVAVAISSNSMSSNSERNENTYIWWNRMRKHTLEIIDVINSFFSNRKHNFFLSVLLFQKLFSADCTKAKSLYICS